MELTKEHFDQAVKGLATQQSVDELAGRMTIVEQLLNSHTTALDALPTTRKLGIWNCRSCANGFSAWKSG
jgi:hypothetical protein